MENTIAFYEQVQIEGERMDFQNLVKSQGLNLFHNWNSLSAKIPTILFFHGNNIGDLKNRSDFGEELKSELNNTWMIEYGGNDSKRKINEGRTVGYIKYSDLNNRLVEVINQIKSLTKIEKENLEEIIFAINPEIEKFLTPFMSVIPIKEAWQGTNLHAAKEKLIKEINKKLNQR